MGATGWNHIVAYQADMNQVLQDLQRDVFRQGAYQKPGIDLSVLAEIGFFEADDEERDQLMAEYTLEPLREPIRHYGLDGLRGWLETLDAAPGVQSRGELEALQCLSWEGTGSILDIGAVGEEPALGALSPLPRERLLHYFGTDQPDRGMLAGKWQVPGQLRQEYERGQGIYFVLYKEGRTDEIYIEGASGD